MNFRDALATAYNVMETQGKDGTDDEMVEAMRAISLALNTGAVLNLTEEQCETVINALRQPQWAEHRDIALDIAADISKQKEGADPR